MTDSGQVLTVGGAAVAALAIAYAIIRALFGRVVTQNDEANKRVEVQLARFADTVEKQFDRFLHQFDEMTKEQRQLIHSNIENTAWRSITDASLNSLRTELLDNKADTKALHQRVTNLVNDLLKKRGSE